jgi:hypothetical protein
MTGSALVLQRTGEVSRGFQRPYVQRRFSCSAEGFSFSSRPWSLFRLGRHTLFLREAGIGTILAPAALLVFSADLFESMREHEQRMLKSNKRCFAYPTVSRMGCRSVICAPGDVARPGSGAGNKR